MEIGALVNCNAYRNADLQADMARTIDHISGGRFIFGTGSGWFERDFTEYGYEFGTAGSRLDALGDALPRIESRWEKLSPPPTRKIPILIGGKGRQKTLRFVARHADIWHSFVQPVELRELRDVLSRWAEVEERDLSNLVISNSLGNREDTEVEELHDLGVRLFTLDFNGPDYDWDTLAKWLKWRDAKNGK